MAVLKQDKIVGLSVDEHPFKELFFPYRQMTEEILYSKKNEN